ncbi:hypothetical protein BGW38_005532 [Lunasporangiospora selenospora]|uniref:BZIP domain-containing protein n=1 Tax=Lunasporangiospora selenospora TaxID=979761 RepID=A0A9P6KHD9_9FUNG|nr:hypothetical protein BGW38_005532 [Lunasporangiospora selenospora]
MSENPYLSLIANLNASSPIISSPEEYSADLSLWTNAEFTFDIPPGLGIFESDSGFDALASLNHPASALTAAPAAFIKTDVKSAGQTIAHNPQSALDQQHLMEYLNLPHEESRPLSLLERTRQRNPASVELAQSQPALQEQAAAINAFHSLLAAYSATAQMQQQQQLQQPHVVQLQQPQTFQKPMASSGLPLLLPNIAPATAPTTPAAAKLLRQPMPQYKANPVVTKRHPKPIQPVVAPAPALAPIAPKSPTTANASAIAAAATAASTAAKVIKTIAPASPIMSETKEMVPSKRAGSISDSSSVLDESDHMKIVAEEDKRRRNTAASARFRFKKKLREQALEQTTKEQTLRAETLEARVKELEMEVKWLRGLIVEKDSRLHEVSAGLEDQSSSKRIKLDVY